MTYEVRDVRAKNRFFIDNEFFDVWVPALGIHAFAVYAALCRHSNREQLAWPAQEKIARETGMSARQVIRMIKRLEEHRIIDRERVGKRVTNKYRLLDRNLWIRPEVKCTGVTSPGRDDVTGSHITDGGREGSPAPHDNFVIPPCETCGKPVDKSEGEVTGGAKVKCHTVTSNSNKTQKETKQTTNPPSVAEGVPSCRNCARGRRREAGGKGSSRGEFLHEERTGYESKAGEESV